MISIRRFPALALTAACCLIAGCAHSQGTRPDNTPGTADDEHLRSQLSDSSVDISYVLGHSHRRFLIWSKNASCGGQTYLDHQVMRESEVDQKHYAEYFGKVAQFVGAPHRKPAEQAVSGQQSTPPVSAEDACRTPFTVTLRVGSDTRVLQGCRGSDEGALSHLVRDGEFLLFSRK